MADNVKRRNLKNEEEAASFLVIIRHIRSLHCIFSGLLWQFHFFISIFISSFHLVTSFIIFDPFFTLYIGVCVCIRPTM